MDKQNLLNFPNESRYDFTSSNDERITELTRHLSRSVSLQQQCFNFKEPTLDRVGCSHSQAPSSPQFVKGDEGAWNMIYAEAGQVARMRMSNSDVIGVPHAVNRPHRTPWENSDGVELLRQQHFCRNSGVFAWPPPQVQNQRHQHCLNQRKPVVLDRAGRGCGAGSTHAKRECAGTGVFLPRRYCNNPPESRIRQACSPSNPPAGMIQSFTKSFIPIITTPPQIQTHINGGFISHYELFMGWSKAMIIAAQQRQRGNIHGMVMEPAVNNPAVLLPQEWTY